MRADLTEAHQGKCKQCLYQAILFAKASLPFLAILPILLTQSASCRGCTKELCCPYVPLHTRLMRQELADGWKREHGEDTLFYISFLLFPCIFDYFGCCPSAVQYCTAGAGAACLHLLSQGSTQKGLWGEVPRNQPLLESRCLCGRAFLTGQPAPCPHEQEAAVVSLLAGQLRPSVPLRLW